MALPTDEQVRAALRAFIRRTGTGGNILARVLSVDEDAKTCRLADDDDEAVVYDDVQLRPVLDGQEAMTLYPAIGSWVTAEQVEDTGRWQVTSVSQVAKWKLVTGATVLEQDSTGLKLAKGTDTLGDVLADLVTAIQSITVNVTAVGSPTGTPLNNAAFAAIANRLNNLLK